jgi:hypothetical protein
MNSEESISGRSIIKLSDRPLLDSNVRYPLKEAKGSSDTICSDLVRRLSERFNSAT